MFNKISAKWRYAAIASLIIAGLATSNPALLMSGIEMVVNSTVESPSTKD